MKRNTILFILVIGALISGGLYYRYHGEETDERGATKLMQALEHEEQLTKETARLIKRSDDVNERDLAGQTGDNRFFPHPSVYHFRPVPVRGFCRQVRQYPG